MGRIIEPVIPKRPSETFRAGTRPRALESFRFSDADDYEYEIFSILSIAHT